MQAMYTNEPLAALLQQPRIRGAIAEISANPAAYEAKYKDDEDVIRALDLLQASMGIVDI